MNTSPSRKLASTVALTAAVGTSLAMPLLNTAAATAATVKKTTTVKTAGVTINGPVVATRWGPVQVAVVLTNNKVTDVKVPVYPQTKRRSAQINARALPMLRGEVLSAQSSGIDNVSGATVTWRGYTESLQKALDTAKAKGSF